MYGVKSMNDLEGKESSLLFKVWGTNGWLQFLLIVMFTLFITACIFYMENNGLYTYAAGVLAVAFFGIHISTRLALNKKYSLSLISILFLGLTPDF